MKKTMLAVLAIALIVTMFCATALAVSGDLTVTDAKAYSDAAMTNYVGTIPAGTSVLVRAYDSYADVYVNGKVVYISEKALLNTKAEGTYDASLLKGTKVYQRADTSAKSFKLPKGGDVNVCAVVDDWALVRTTGSLKLFGFVKVDKLVDIRLAD